MNKVLYKPKIAINGFGRIGRTLTRFLFQDGWPFDLVAINDLAPAPTMAHLLEFDSVHRRFPGEVSWENETLMVGDKRVNLLHEKDPLKLPWKEMEVDLVFECTGKLKSAEKASAHLTAGAKRCILSAVSSSEGVKTIVPGVNHSLIEASDKLLSNASCTTNSAAPLIAIISEICDIDSAFITTVHSYTGDQRIHDSEHADLRRARAAATSIIPTTTGAAKAVTRIFPHLEGRIGGAGIRVPVINGSLTDITFHVNKPVSKEVINERFRTEALGKYKGILEYTEKPIVSVDILSNRHSCIFDAQLTAVVGNMVKVVGWYDNEAGYSSRLIDLAKIWSARFPLG